MCTPRGNKWRTSLGDSCLDLIGDGIERDIRIYLSELNGQEMLNWRIVNSLMHWPVVLAMLSAVVITAGVVIWGLRSRLVRTERERRRAAEELNRRLSELFSLQELSYVLSDSLELDRIVEQVVRYAVRFLDAQGALLALVGDAPRDAIQVAAAEGTLSSLRGRTLSANDDGLVVRSAGRDHLELVRNSGQEQTAIVEGFQAGAAAA